MATRSQKVKLGVFLTVAGVLLAVTIVVFAGVSMFDSKDRYHILFTESVSGLELGSAVKLRGVRVGQVSRVRLNPDNVEQVKVTVLLDAGTPIKEDTAAILQMQGITGMKFVELLEGTRKAKKLEPDGYIKAGESLVAKVSDRAQSLTMKADQVLDNLLVLTGEENQRAVAETLSHVATMVKRIDEMSANLNQIIAQVNTLLKDNHDPINGVLASAEDVTRRVDTMIGNANELIVDLRRVIRDVELRTTIAGIDETNRMIQRQFEEVDIGGTINNVTVTLASMQLVLEQLTRLMGQNQEELRATMYNVRMATQSIKEFSRTVEERPSSLVFEKKPKKRKLP